MKWFPRFECAIGLWLIVAPWILGYASAQAALWNSVILGAAVGLIGLWGVFGEKA